MNEGMNSIYVDQSYSLTLNYIINILYDYIKTFYLYKCLSMPIITTSTTQLENKMSKSHDQFVLMANTGNPETFIWFAGAKHGQPSFTDNINEAEIFDERDNKELKIRFLKAISTLDFFGFPL